MKTKPIFFKIICCLFLIEPLVKLAYFKITTDFSLTLILSNSLARNSFIDIFSFWLAFPLAGLCLIKLRNWTYFIFLYLLIFNSYVILTYERYTWPYNSDAPFLYNYMLSVVAIIIMATFLLPVIREPFFNDKLRWWETRKRFKLQIPGSIFDDIESSDVWIENMSYTGVLLKTTSKLEIGEEVILSWKYEGFTLSMPVKIVRQHDSEGVTFGGHFHDLSFQAKIELYRFILYLEKLNGTQNTNEDENKELLGTHKV